MKERIEEYGMIGNLRTIALVSKSGGIDWLCLPNFDSSACFSSLLGTQKNGQWAIRPVSEYRSTRRYRKDTLILETEFETAEGKCEVIDFMASEIKDEPVLIRLVRGISGRVRMKCDMTLRFDYGSITPSFKEHQKKVFSAIAGPDAVRVEFPVAMSLQNSDHVEDATITGEFEVKLGDTLRFVMIWHPSHEPMPMPEKIDAEKELAMTEAFWKHWISQCKYQGKYSDIVRRSLITLKALTFEPTGGIVAAPTTSLPETLGGERNWDYRYCWLRDATLSLQTLLRSGYPAETKAWKRFALRAFAGTKTHLNIMYSIHGNRRLPECELPWLPGYENSTPVRTGNGAYDQLQLDAVGESMDLMYSSLKSGTELGDMAWHTMHSSLAYLEEAWKLPDQGLWEVRGEPQHFTYSKMMAWLAFDRASKMAVKRGESQNAKHWEKIAKEIHQEICEKAYDPELKAFVAFYGGKVFDASLLMLILRGFLPVDDPRMAGTIAAVQRELTEDGFVYRYHVDQTDDGLKGKESPFLFCNFWLVDCLVLQGKYEEAEELFEKTLGVANDLGLLAEEYELDSKRLLGNFPQAFSHIGVIDSAYMLTHRELRGIPKDSQKTVDQTSWMKAG